MSSADFISNIKTLALGNVSIRNAIMNFIPFDEALRGASDEERQALEAFEENKEPSQATLKKTLTTILDIYLRNPTVLDKIGKDEKFAKLINEEIKHMEELEEARKEAEEAYGHVDETLPSTQPQDTQSDDLELRKPPYARKANIDAASRSNTEEGKKYHSKAKDVFQKEVEAKRRAAINQSTVRANVSDVLYSTVKTLLTQSGNPPTYKYIKNSARIIAYILSKYDVQITNDDALQSLGDKPSLSALIAMAIRTNPDLIKELAQDSELSSLLKEEQERIDASSPDSIEEKLSISPEYAQTLQKVTQIAEAIKAKHNSGQQISPAEQQQYEQAIRTRQHIINEVALNVAELLYPEIHKEIQEINDEIRSLGDEYSQLVEEKKEIDKDPVFKKKGDDLTDEDKDHIKKLNRQKANITRHQKILRSKINNLAEIRSKLSELIIAKAKETLKDFKEKGASAEHRLSSELIRDAIATLKAGESLSADQKKALNDYDAGKPPEPMAPAEITQEELDKAHESSRKKHKAIALSPYLDRLKDGGAHYSEKFDHSKRFEQLGQKTYAAIELTTIIKHLLEDLKAFEAASDIHGIRTTLQNIAKILIIAEKLAEDPSLADKGSELLDLITEEELEAKMANIESIGDLKDRDIDREQLIKERITEPFAATAMSLSEGSASVAVTEKSESLYNQAQREPNAPDNAQDLNGIKITDHLISIADEKDFEGFLLELTRLYKHYAYRLTQYQPGSDEYQTAQDAVLKLVDLAAQFQDKKMSMEKVKDTIEHHKNAFNKEDVLAKAEDQAGDGVSTQQVLRSTFSESIKQAAQTQLDTEGVHPVVEEEIQTGLGISDERWKEMFDNPDETPENSEPENDPDKE